MKAKKENRCNLKDLKEMLIAAILTGGGESFFTAYAGRLKIELYGEGDLLAVLTPLPSYRTGYALLAELSFTRRATPSFAARVGALLQAGGVEIQAARNSPPEKEETVNSRDRGLLAVRDYYQRLSAAPGKETTLRGEVTGRRDNVIRVCFSG